MLIRFTVITSSTTWQRHVMPRELSEKKTFKPKSVPIAKITTVHVAAEDPPNRVELGSEEEKQSAVIALSVELTKQLSRNLYPYRGGTVTSITATESALLKKAVASGNLMPWALLVPLQHTLFVQQLQYQGSSRMVRQEGVISSSSSGTSNCGSTGSNNPAKAIAETTLTRVSAGGDITIQLFPDVETHSAVAVLEEQHRQAAIFEMTCDSASTQTMIRPDDSTLPQHRLNLQQEMFPPSPDVFLVKPPSERRSISVNGNPVLPPFEVLQPPSITNPQLFDQQLKSPTSWFGTLTGLFTQRPDHDRPGTKQNEKFSAMISGIKANKLSRKIVIIGVHGWFPMKLVRSMIGQPTGTSKKFCNQMEIALRQYFLLEHHFVMPEDAVTIIPLEGEGKIEERVEKLYDQLVSNLTWLQAFSAAEVILWGTHSQGMPVSVMLLHQLLQENHIHTQQTAVCMLSMAGIGHGPFPALQGNLIVKYFEASAARELFDFMDSAKAISERFRRSLAYVLENGVKLTLVGSLQDQVVPLHSGILTSISHPNILRSVYIDKHIYTEDDFLINLVVFAIRLRNAGLPDHGLLVHVSEVLAGSIYAIGGGHSTIYEELDVYLMAIRYLFDHHPKRTDLSYTTATVEVKPFKAKQHLNPFHLPWAVRGVFDDKMILAESWAVDELKRLLQLFQQWTPTSTRLREVKFRLEPLAEHML